MQTRITGLKYLLLLLLFFCTLVLKAQHDFTTYVNPFIGTGGHGHTYPGATLPFGMVQLSPDTRIDQSWDGCSGYHYSDSILYGFSHTHLSGTGVPDFCDILLMPVGGDVLATQLKERSFWSAFSHSTEEASPGYYAVNLQKDNITVSLTATERTGFHKYVFNQQDKAANLVLDLVHRDKVLNGLVFKISDTRVAGIRQSSSWARNQSVIFVMDFSQPFESAIGGDGEVFTNREPVSGTNTRVCFRFKNNGPIYVKVSLSPVTVEGAIKNMEVENPGWDFEKIKALAHEKWKKELNKIEIFGGTADERTIFYTALYHCLIVPNLAMDVDSIYHGRDDRSHKADSFVNYSVFSLWDTFRAWHPLMTIIDRKRTLDYIHTFLVQSDQGRMLPVWELAANETECMIGYHAVSVIADAAAKDIKGFDYQKALTAMKKSAEAEYRYGLGAYMSKGYIGIEDEPESVSKTLEYAYDDWCIAQMAHLIGNKKEERTFLLRSQYWKNIFDPQTGFARPKRNGNWFTPFDPKEVNNHFTEANSWQYTFFVPQDIPGFIKKMGGPLAFEKKLDGLFSESSETTGRQQSDITGLIGQYAHGNEPSHHIAYLYNDIGKLYKTQEKVLQVMKEMYYNAPDGLIGNEDCGQMSAWFVLSAMGFYQVTPGKPEFHIGIPLFDSIKVHLENGKTFSINRERTTNDSIPLFPYINGNPIASLKYKDIMEGKTLSFKKLSEPILSKPDLTPAKSDTFIIVPLIEANEVFKEKTSVTIRSDQKYNQLYYAINNPDSLIWKKFEKPFEINSSVTIFAYAKNQQGRKSFVSSASLHKMPHPGWKIILTNPYSSQYHAGGPEGLFDGIRGDENWRKGYWQGYWGKNFEAIIDLGKITAIDTVIAGFLQDTRAWILMPKEVTFSFSENGISYTDALSFSNKVPDEDYREQTQEIIIPTGRTINARYLKISAINYGKLPNWHAGFGGEAYIFIDEIDIR